MTTTEDKGLGGTFFVKLRCLIIENASKNTKLPLNEAKNKFDGKFNDINYKRIVMNLHNTDDKKVVYFC